MSSHLVYDVLVKNCHFNKGGRILDYGTGDGLFLNQLASDFKITGIGIDRLAKRIGKAIAISDKNHLRNSFICSNFDSVNFHDKFDKVLCLDVLEHLEKPTTDLKRISRLLKDDGELVIQTPRDKDKKYILNDSEQVFTYGKDEHKQEGFSLEELTKLLNNCDLSIKYWRSTFSPFSQIMYEILELIRRRNKFIYSIIWPIIYPLCYIDFIINKRSRSNGLFVIAIKSK